MPLAAIATIFVAILVVLALVGFLVAIARVLLDIGRQLTAVVAVVGEIAARTEPVNPVVDSINSNLSTAGARLHSLLVDKVGADAAAELIASVDPMARPEAQRQAPIRYERPHQSESGDAAPHGESTFGDAPRHGESTPPVTSGAGGTIRLVDPEGGPSGAQESSDAVSREP